MELQKPQVDPRKKTLEATAVIPKKPEILAERLPDSPPLISSSLQHHPTGHGNAAEPSKEGEEGVEQNGTELPTIGAASGTTAAAVAVSGPNTDLQRKLLRAERFGMPVQMSEEEKRNSRSERFGTASTLSGEKVGGEMEEHKRKARAERFGLAGNSTADEEAKKKARSERFGQNPKPDTIEEEKRKARAIRFAPASRAPSEANDKADNEPKAAVAET